MEMRTSPQVMNDYPSLRKPISEDGLALHKLVANCSPLDPNSLYCNLLQCTHFRDTCVAAELHGKLVGFVSAYLPPAKANTLFVWQVAIAESQRGQGLAKTMVKALLNQLRERQVNFLETTITPDNEASWALFNSLARELGTKLESAVWFERERHFGGDHSEEHLVRIGPFSL